MYQRKVQSEKRLAKVDLEQSRTPEQKRRVKHSVLRKS